MRLTHFGHACVLAEFSGARILFDPGKYSTGFETLRELTAVLITHNHPDHIDLARLRALVGMNPDAELIADKSTAANLLRHGMVARTLPHGDPIAIAGITVRAFVGDHAVIHPEVSCPSNTGYLLDGTRLHPGDAFIMPPVPVSVLLLPAGGPWMKVSESVDYLRAVSPDIAIPVHELGLADIHRQLHYQLFGALKPVGTQFHVLDHGVATLLPLAS
ncbi:MBL fold metallo-hydrolase [Nocardia sp. NPDC052278]|uniref:MBL fold metallo-hydrolase n=1 Tax=unclassified Nocardia TaxID=2637762 RepID=UPI003682F476